MGQSKAERSSFDPCVHLHYNCATLLVWIAPLATQMYPTSTQHNEHVLLHARLERLYIAGVFGETITADLIEGGPTVSVTNANRADFVARYVDYVLNKSVELQVRPG